MAATKVNLWPIISNVALIICIGFLFTNIMSSRTLKTEIKASQAKETLLMKKVSVNQMKIDSLQREIVKRDLIIDNTQATVFTLEQFKDKYEKDYNHIDIMSIDDNIKLFAIETSN